MSERIIAGLQDALDHAKQHRKDLVATAVGPTPQEVRELRHALGLSQQQFAERYNINLSDLRAFEY